MDLQEMNMLLILIVTVLCSNVANAATMRYTKLLLQDLFQNYSKDIRPVEDQSKAVNVNIDLDLVSINDFDEVAGIISMVVILYISWRDESLVWDSTLYGNTTFLTLPQNKVWLPTMFLCNIADSFLPISNKHFKVVVTSDGNVTWAPGNLLQATCSPDVYKYPFDQQTCGMHLSAWGYSSRLLKLNLLSRTVRFSYFTLNSEWDVIKSRTEHWSQSFDMAVYYITIERRHLNFLVSVVIPVIMLALVNPFVFILPFNSGERASYSITVLLAFTVYMTVVSDRMPASSQPMSYISYYLLSLVGISVVIVTMDIFQIRMYNKNDDDEPVSGLLRKMYMSIQNVFRGKKVNANDQPCESADTRSKTSNMSDKMRTQSMELESPEKINDLFYTSILPVSQMEEKPSADNIPIRSQNQPEVVTWHMVAKMVDTFYFFLFLSITVVTTISYFINVNVG